MIIKRYQVFFFKLVNKKWRMWRIAFIKANGGRDYCVEIVSDLHTKSTSKINTFTKQLFAII